jgi:hypothetical protein
MEQHQGRLAAARVGQAQSRWPLGCGRFGCLARRQQELESPQRVAVRRVKQAEGADSVQSLESMQGNLSPYIVAMPQFCRKNGRVSESVRE